MSFQPQSTDYRRSLDLVAHDPRVIWWDYTAKTDGACFPLLDFVTASGIERREAANLKNPLAPDSSNFIRREITAACALTGIRCIFFTFYRRIMRVGTIIFP
jgi:hypothetical protein